MILEGNVSVKAAIMAGRRKVEKLYIAKDKHDKDSMYILHRAEDKGIEIIRPERQVIDDMAQGRTHGGLVAVAESMGYQDIEDCFEENSFLVCIEGVEDPFNLGYMLRSLYSAGCSGVLLRQRDWTSAEATILKASAGASEWINVVLCSDMPAAVRQCRQRGLYAYAAMRRDAIPYFEADFSRPVLIGIGGEMRGLSAAVLKEMDQNIYIPYANDFRNALNAAGAAAAIGFELMRQRQYAGS